jgi:hypothetical protein
MKFLAAYSIIIISILTGALAWLYSRHNEPAHLKITIYDELMPGNPMPAYSYCLSNLDSTPDYHPYCYAKRGKEIGFAFNRNTDRIDSVTYVDLQDQVSDLYSTFGKPTGYICDEWSYTFFWKDRRAYIVPHSGLSMYTTVGIITFGSPDRDYQPMSPHRLLPNDCDPPWR